MQPSSASWYLSQINSFSSRQTIGIPCRRTTHGVPIDSLRTEGDSVTVYTRQRYERLMHQRTGPILDTVETSVKDRELGPILVNGQPYTP